MFDILVFAFLLLTFFILHIFFQNIFFNNLIKNFTASLLLNNLFMWAIFYKYNLILENKFLIFLNVFLSLFIYLILVQAVRSSIQIYILKNYKKIKIANLNKENFNIFNKRIENLCNNNIIIKNKYILIDSAKVVLNLVYYIFYFLKKIYNEKY
tara:strand:- start:773 stop:1234 length:462 start_codon:yes stop_codon:yes gene_type:complete